MVAAIQQIRYQIIIAQTILIVRVTKFGITVELVAQRWIRTLVGIETIFKSPLVRIISKCTNTIIVSIQMIPSFFLILSIVPSTSMKKSLWVAKKSVSLLILFPLSIDIVRMHIFFILTWQRFYCQEISLRFHDKRNSSAFT